MWENWNSQMEKKKDQNVTNYACFRFYFLKNKVKRSKEQTNIKLM